MSLEDPKTEVGKKSRSWALITGGTSGIGSGIAQQLAPQFNLALIYARDRDRAELERARLLKLHREAYPDLKINLFAQDLLSLEALPRLYKDIVNECGQAPLVLVNSAGRLRDGLFQGSDFKVHVETLHEHLLASMALCHLAIKGMSQARFGRIINLSSISAHFAKRGQTNYAAAKAGLEGFTRTLALEVAHRGVTVNCIAPGLIETAMTKEFLEKIELSGDGLRKRIPVGRAGTVDEVGALAAFLCSRQADYITGTTITIDGGRSLGDPQS